MDDIKPDFNVPTCRVCLQSNESTEEMEEMPCIFMDMDDSNEFIYLKIERCAGIKLIRSEELPTLICRKCNAFLSVAYKFRTMVRNSNDYLREYVLQKRIENGEDIHDLDFNEYDEETASNSNNNSSSNNNNNRTDNKYKIVNINNKAENEVKSMNEDSVMSDSSYVEIWLQGSDAESEQQMMDDENYRVEEVEALDAMPNSDSSWKKTLGIGSDGAAVIKKKKIPSNYVVKTMNSLTKTLVTTVDGKVPYKKEKGVHQCELCGNSFDRPYALQYHMRRHRKEKSFKCELCSAAFYSNFEINRHMRTHTGEKPFSCTYCNRAFSDRSTLTKHERIHRNERPFQCGDCGKTFTYSSVLKSHILTHTGEKPYGCELCGKRFSRSHHLRAHLETIQHKTDPRALELLQNINFKEERVDESYEQIQEEDDEVIQELVVQQIVNS